MDMSETQPVMGPTVEALLATMPDQIADDARGVRDLFIVSGCPVWEAQHTVVELYSPPRAAREFPTPSTSRACPSLAAGSAVDLHEGEAGQRYDFLLARGRQRCRDRLKAERPWLVIGSPPCTWWSSLVALSRGNMSDEEVRRRDTEARTLLHCACVLSSAASCARAGTSRASTLPA